MSSTASGASKPTGCPALALQIPVRRHRLLALGAYSDVSLKLAQQSLAGAVSSRPH